MADATKIKVGVCSVVFNGLDLGHTKGGVEVSYEPAHYDVMVDKYGGTPVEKILVGEKWTAKVALAEATIANFRVSMPQTEFAGAGNSRITVGAAAGKKATDDAKQLVLHPINEGTKAFDVVFYKAYVGSTIALPHKNDSEKLVEVVFEALIDESRSDGNYLGLIGDSTL